MDRQREVSRAFTTGRGPLRILYIMGTGAIGEDRKRAGSNWRAGFFGIEIDGDRSCSVGFGSDLGSERKCCNFEKGDGGRPERSWAARFQAARSNSWSMN